MGTTSKSYKGPMLVVGFGKENLTELVKFIDQNQDELFLKAIMKGPRYRRPDICSDEEKDAYVKYGAWLEKHIPADKLPKK